MYIFSFRKSFGKTETIQGQEKNQISAIKKSEKQINES